MAKKLLLFMPVVIFIVILSVGTATTAAFAADTTISDWGVEYFSEDTTGIYWYTEIDGDVPTRDYKIDPTKPTVIYAHGWKPNQSNVREGLSVKDKTRSALSKHKQGEYKYDTEFYNYYLNNGYNVGVFYWNQLADEGQVSFNVVEKIWYSGNGKNMKYVTYNEAGKKTISKEDDPLNPKESVAMIFGKEIIKALGSDFSSSLQIIGHSMGGELVCATAEYLCLLYDDGEVGKNILPQRVTMLDPYLPANTINGLVDTKNVIVNDVTVSELTAMALKTIKDHDIAVEGFGVNLGMVFRNYSSVGGKITEEAKKKVTEMLAENCAWVYLKGFENYGSFDPTHVMAVDYYFTCNYIDAFTYEDGTPMPGPKTSTEDIKKIMGMSFIQHKPDSKDTAHRPIYADETTFGICNFKSNTLAEYTEDDNTGRIYGKIEVEHRDGKKLGVKLYDENNKLVADKQVGNTGTYYFDELADGKYTIKVYADYMYSDTSVDVEVNQSAQKTVLGTEMETIKIKMGGDKFLFITIMVLAAILLVVCVVALVNSVINAKKNKNAK